mmetsp:Transcript_28274/g.59409  ORF Transcript_28274/g.59409 Transcript_28274/m.59409 type:complete len:230 (-) Transcript_28274:205-894(-)|eukprot:6173472-Pleurochrysis_carterae.AAC.3
MTGTTVDAKAIYEKVDFDLAMRNLMGNHSSLAKISFKGVLLGSHPEWLSAFCEALAANSTCTELDLSSTSLTDSSLQKLVIQLSMGSAKQLQVVHLRDNPFTLSGETMLQGLQRLRPSLQIELAKETTTSIDGFVHNKMLVEGLTAWPAESLCIPGGNELRCPESIVGSEEVVVLKKGFQGSNGTKYTCEHAEFELGHGTGNLVLKRLEPEAKMRLCTVSREVAGGTLV